MSEERKRAITASLRLIIHRNKRSGITYADTARRLGLTYPVAQAIASLIGYRVSIKAGEAALRRASRQSRIGKGRNDGPR